jgi:hypothetical protein
VSDILIRNIDPLTKERLRRRAKRRGKSLEADLRDALEQLAREDSGNDTRPGFGSWLVALSRPGLDIAPALAEIRRAPPRRVDFD